jgi:23S rRNA pseudouridine2605 synthase
MQLNKFLSQAGVDSRRGAVELIKKGSVRVNNTVIKDPAYRVAEGDTVTVHGKPVIAQELKYIMLNKPAGFVTTVSDELGRDTVMDLLKDVKERLYPIGRLDKNTTGLLLLTNDGDLAVKLSHPSSNIEKVYHVTLHKPFTEQDRDRILAGIRLKDGKVRADRVSHALGVKKLDRVQYAFLPKKGLSLGCWRKLTKKEVDALKKLVTVTPKPKGK